MALQHRYSAAGKGALDVPEVYSPEARQRVFVHEKPACWFLNSQCWLVGWRRFNRLWHVMNNEQQNNQMIQVRIDSW